MKRLSISRIFIAVLALLMLCAVSSFVCADNSGFAEPIDTVFKAKVDGTEQRYVLMLPVGFNAADTHDLAIALHGHGSDRWQYAKRVFDEANATRDVAAKHNMIFISPDYRATTSWMGELATIV